MRQLILAKRTRQRFPILRSYHPVIYGPVCLLFFFGCGGSSPTTLHQTAHEIDYSAIEDSEVWFRHSQIRLRFDRDMYCRVFFLKDGRLRSINDIPPDPAKAKPPHYIEVDGSELRDFRIDYRNVGMSDIKTQFGTGKSLHLTGYSKTATGLSLEKNLTIEFYQDYPDMAILWAVYRNREKDRSVQITRTINSFFRLDAARSKTRTPSYAFWGFRKGTEGDDLFQIASAHFIHAYEASAASGRLSMPLLDLWTTEMGMAIGEISPQPTRQRLIVEVAPDKKVEISIQCNNPQSLGPNESLIIPKSIWMVHTGDYKAVVDRYTALTRQPG
jgi:hypothetical protein